MAHIDVDHPVLCVGPHNREVAAEDDVLQAEGKVAGRERGQHKDVGIGTRIGLPLIKLRGRRHILVRQVAGDGVVVTFNIDQCGQRDGQFGGDKGHIRRQVQGSEDLAALRLPGPVRPDRDGSIDSFGDEPKDEAHVFPSPGLAEVEVFIADNGTGGIVDNGLSTLYFCAR